MGYGVWGKSKSKSNACVNEEVDSLEIVPIYLAVCCKVRKANFTSFPSKSADKARVVFKLYLGVRSKLKKKTDYSYVIFPILQLLCLVLPAPCLLVCHLTGE